MPEPVKIPSRDIFNLDNQTFDVAEIEEALFEDIGGTELINVLRHDTVDGIDIFYSIVPDLSQTTIEFDPSKLLTSVSVYDQYISQYNVRLSEKIPTTDYVDNNIFLPDSNIASNAYYSSQNKLVIELDNVTNRDKVQIYFLKNATINRVRENDY